MTGQVTAGTKYTSGTPELSAYISGTNEFSPADDVLLSIVIENKGLNEYKYVQSSTADRDDPPNTAKSVIATLMPGDAPVTVKSDARMAGDIKGGSRATVSFNVKINSGAHGGTYNLPVELDYSFLENADQFSGATLKNYYTPQKTTILVPIIIKPDVSVKVLSAAPESLSAGTDGYINMTITNAGSETGKKSVLKLVRNGISPINPLENSVYIGDFPPGSIVNLQYKVSVDSNAQNQSYPVDVVVSYENNEGDMVDSRTETLGVPVGGKVEFTIVSQSEVMHPGSKKEINIEYKNTGDTVVRSAQARISAVDPFTGSRDVAYLGDLNPGESAVASYVLSVDRMATIKMYGLDSEIRYRDALDNTYISEVMKVNVDVKNQTGIAGILSNPVYLSVIIAALVGVAYIIIHYVRKNRQNK